MTSTLAPPTPTPTPHPCVRLQDNPGLKADLPMAPDGLPEMKPEDMQFFSKLLQVKARPPHPTPPHPLRPPVDALRGTRIYGMLHIAPGLGVCRCGWEPGRCTVP